MRDNIIEVFFALVRAGLWETDVKLAAYGEIDYESILRLSREQSIVGLVAAGLEHVVDVKVPQMWALQFAGETIQIEQRNKEMNNFIAEIVDKMRNVGIYTLLVKGQGIAQCYERPYWRTSGDVDFFLSDSNYQKAKEFLLPLSSVNKPERMFSKELGFSIGRWFVEIHGTQRTGLSSGLDKSIDDLQRIAFYDGKVRSWMNGKTQVFLPAADEDVLIVFTHFLKHFYKDEGVSLRQICDWCRLLWTYRERLNLRLLKFRLQKMRLMKEWNAFGNVAIKFLGMPKDVMPLYGDSKFWQRMAEMIVNVILFSKSHGRLTAVYSTMKMFPISTMRFLPGILFDVNWLKVKERFFINPSI